MTIEPEEKAAKQKYTFNMVSLVLFIVLGIVLLTGWFVPYAPLPNEDLLVRERGSLSFNKQNESFDFTSSTGLSVPLCKNTWINAKYLSSYFAQTKEKQAEVKVYPEGQKNRSSRCLTVFGLTIDEKAVVEIDDVKKAKEFMKLIFNSIAIIFILVGLIKGYSLRKSIDS